MDPGAVGRRCNYVNGSGHQARQHARNRIDRRLAGAVRDAPDDHRIRRIRRCDDRFKRQRVALGHGGGRVPGNDGDALDRHIRTGADEANTVRQDEVARQVTVRDNDVPCRTRQERERTDLVPLDAVLRLVDGNFR